MEVDVLSPPCRGAVVSHIHQFSSKICSLHKEPEDSQYELRRVPRMSPTNWFPVSLLNGSTALYAKGFRVGSMYRCAYYN